MSALVFQLSEIIFLKSNFLKILVNGETSVPGGSTL